MKFNLQSRFYLILSMIFIFILSSVMMVSAETYKKEKYLYTFKNNHIEQLIELNLAQNTKGILISQIKNLSETGLKIGDVIYSVNHKKVRNVNEFIQDISSLSKNTKPVFGINRGKNKVKLQIPINQLAIFKQTPISPKTPEYKD